MKGLMQCMDKCDSQLRSFVCWQGAGDWRGSLHDRRWLPPKRNRAGMQVFEACLAELSVRVQTNWFTCTPEIEVAGGCLGLASEDWQYTVSPFQAQPARARD
jgi:hypothetical protein